MSKSVSQYGILSSFVGRDKELTILKNCFEQASSGIGNLVLIEGEAGIGKTRLVNEFLTSLKEVRILKGRCARETEAPYLPIIESISAYFKSAKQIGEKEKMITEAERNHRQLKNSISDLTAFLYSSPALTDFKRSLAVENVFTERFRIFDLLLQFLTHLSKQQPLLLFIDDLHWVDNATLDLLHYLAMNIQKLPILIIGAYRPEELHDVEVAYTSHLVEVMRQMSRQRLFLRVKLERLDPHEVKHVLDFILKSYEFPNEFIDIFYKETEGNPFFVEAVLKYMIENDEIRFENGKWQFKSEALSIEFPESVKDIVTSRLKQLFPADLNVLECAATIGNNFSFDVLREVCDLKDEQLLDIIDKLALAQIIVEDRNSEKGDYQFAHLKLREIVYNGIKLEYNKINHVKVGFAIEKLYQSHLDEVIYDLGYHFFKGGEFEKACIYLTQAGEHALKLSATDEAKKYCALALQSLDRLDDTRENRSKKLELLNFIGDIYRLTGELDKARKSYTQALKLSEILGDVLREAKTHRNIGNLKLEEDLLESASIELKTALSLSNQISDFYGMADAYRGLGKVSCKLSEFDNAVEVFKKSMEYWIKYYDTEQWSESDSSTKKEGSLYEENRNAIVGSIFIDMGNVYISKNDNDNAIECYEKGIEILENARQSYELSRAYNNLGFAYMMKGNTSKALECFKKSIELSEKAKYIILEIHGFNNLGTCYEQLGELDSAKKYWQKAEELMGRLELKTDLHVL